MDIVKREKNSFPDLFAQKLVRVYTTPETFEKLVFSLKTHQVSSIHTTTEKWSTS